MEYTINMKKRKKIITKTIRVSDKAHTALRMLAAKNNKTIIFLIDTLLFK